MSNQEKKISTPIDVNMIDKIDKNIHEPSRLKILAHLFTLEHTDFTYLKNLTEFSWGRLSSHLDKLEEAGYVQLEKKLVKKIKNGKETPKTFIYLTEKGKEAFENYRKSMKKLFR
ncbi:MAG: transcriptional regulator [Candidatus Hodarchaeales archaeon]|jgi:DNA-binding MarR family transcriptional regulator